MMPRGRVRWARLLHGQNVPKNNAKQMQEVVVAGASLTTSVKSKRWMRPSHGLVVSNDTQSRDKNEKILRGHMPILHMARQYMIQGKTRTETITLVGCGDNKAP